MAEGKRIGTVVHWFGKVSVAVVELKADLKLGDRVHFEGAHTDFHQEIESMQIEHETVEQASKGEEVAIKVKERVRTGDTLYKHEGE